KTLVYVRSVHNAFFEDTFLQKNNRETISLENRVTPYLPNANKRVRTQKRHQIVAKLLQEAGAIGHKRRLQRLDKPFHRIFVVQQLFLQTGYRSNLFLSNRVRDFSAYRSRRKVVQVDAVQSLNGLQEELDFKILELRAAFFPLLHA